MNMKDKYFYIEFEIGNIARYKNLQKIFLKLKEVKNDWIQNGNSKQEKTNLDYRDPLEDIDWYSYLDNYAIAWFEDAFDYNSLEGQIYWRVWELTQPEIRLQHPFFKTPGNWDFESMLDAIFNGDYLLIDLVKEKDNRGILYYNPLGYPFGGSDSLIELIRAFGNQIIYDLWHKGIPIRKSEWNYELARKLVLKGIGFTPEILKDL